MPSPPAGDRLSLDMGLLLSGLCGGQTSDQETRDMLSYARLVIREAQCHGGAGWLEYDKWFRQQQAALAKPHPWNELNASLHAATVMSLKSGETRLCKLCWEPALASFQAHLQPALALPPLSTSKQACHQARDPGTHLEQGPVCFPRLLSVPPRLCHVPQQGSSGQGL